MKILLPIIIVAGVLLAGLWFYNRDITEPMTYATPAVGTTTATTTTSTLCVDELAEGTPVITSISKTSGSVGDTIELKGCNFNGFEGDLIAWIENAQGVKGLLRGDASSTAKLMRVKLEAKLCQEETGYSGLPCSAYLNLTPGAYKIYTIPWGTKSNEVTFTIK